jgi:1,2-diacylglycerol 3-beta-galactosyltransferase
MTAVIHCYHYQFALEKIMKRILILIADYGFGHHSAANAISESLLETYGQSCVVEIVNPLEDQRAPAFFRNEQADYDRIVQEMPDLYKLGYQVSDSLVGCSFIKSAVTLLLSDLLRNIVREHQPDVIVCTFSIYPAILSAIFNQENHRVPIITVITDMGSVHSLWFYPHTDLSLVPNQFVYDLALEAGLQPQKVKITGIPVHPDLAKGNQDQAAIRLSLGWDLDLFTILAVGSKRVGNLYETIHVLNHSGLPIQLVVISGGDDELYDRFQQTEWHLEAHSYNYVSNMSTLMRAADCVLSKAGGLIVTEALACGLPLLLIHAIPGQETGNVDYVLNGSAGDLVQEPTEVLEVVCHWLENNRALYQVRRQNAQQLGHPQAAEDVAAMVWSVAMGSGEASSVSPMVQPLVQAE